MADQPIPKQKRRLSRGQWSVQKERFQLPEDEKPPLTEREASPLKQVVPALLREFGLEDRLWEHTLESDWVEIVGQSVAKHARPGRIQRGVLYVFVRHSAWLAELSRFGQKEMLAAIQQRFGANKIKSIRLQLDPDGFDANTRR